MKEQLIRIGFGDKEAEIYLALIKLGRANIAELMKKTSVERRTIYDVLERLMQKGWVSYHEENKKKYYAPAKPELILEDLEHKKQEFKEIIAKINALKEKKLIEILSELFSSTSKTIFQQIGDINQAISETQWTPGKCLTLNQHFDKIVL